MTRKKYVGNSVREGYPTRELQVLVFLKFIDHIRLSSPDIANDSKPGAQVAQALRVGLIIGGWAGSITRSFTFRSCVNDALQQLGQGQNARRNVWRGWRSESVGVHEGHGHPPFQGPEEFLRRAKPSESRSIDLTHNFF